MGDDNEWWMYKDLEGVGSDLFRDAILIFAFEDWGKPRQTSFMTADIPLNIRTGGHQIQVQNVTAAPSSSLTASLVHRFNATVYLYTRWYESSDILREVISTTTKQPVLHKSHTNTITVTKRSKQSTGPFKYSKHWGNGKVTPVLKWTPRHEDVCNA
jgi:hypothetical protein